MSSITFAYQPRLSYLFQMRKKKCLILLPFLFVYFFAISQSNFVKGTIINNNGDSINGTIDYRNWKNNPLTINFIYPNNEKKTFDASSIKGFYIPSANEIYTSFTVDMDMLAGNPEDAINRPAPDSPSGKRIVFLQQLIKSPVVSLYYFAGDRKEHFYYQKEKEAPVELIHQYIYNESSKRLQENAAFRIQLSDLVSNCADAANASQAIKYSRKQIGDIIIQYIQCTSPGSPIDIKKKEPLLVKFGILAGIMKNSLTIEGTSALADENYGGNVSPLFGASLDIGLSRNRYKWHIINELMYKAYKTNSTFTRPFGSGYTVNRTVDLAFSYVQLNTMLRYIVKTKSTPNPFVNAGIGTSVMIAENKNTVRNVFSFGTDETIPAIDGPKKYEFSLQGGAGLSVGNMQFELRYTANKKGFSPSYGFDTNPTSLQVIFTWQFKK